MIELGSHSNKRVHCTLQHVCALKKIYIMIIEVFLKTTYVIGSVYKTLSCKKHYLLLYQLRPQKKTYKRNLMGRKLIRDKWSRKIDWEGGNNRDKFREILYFHRDVDMVVCMKSLFLPIYNSEPANNQQSRALRFLEWILL